MNIKKTQILANSSPTKEQETPNYTEIKTMSSMIHLPPPKPPKIPNNKKSKCTARTVPIPGRTSKRARNRSRAKIRRGSGGREEGPGLAWGRTPAGSGRGGAGAAEEGERRGKQLKL